MYEIRCIYIHSSHSHKNNNKIFVEKNKDNLSHDILERFCGIYKYKLIWETPK